MKEVIFLALFIITFFLIKRKKNYKKAFIISIGITLLFWFIYDIIVDTKNDSEYIDIMSSDEYTCKKKIPNIFIEIEDFTI